MTKLFVAVILGALTAGDSPPSSPYCGLYCVHAAAHALGRPTEFEEILNKEYLSAGYGSTDDDLRRALLRCGVDAVVVRNMTGDQLQVADAPVILHVRAPGSDTGYRHWVLFLGFRGTKVRLYDPPRSMSTITFEELQSIWDGVAILTSTEANSNWLCWLPLEWLILVGFAGLLLCSTRKGGSVLIFSLTTGLVLLRHAILPGGFARSANAVTNVIAAHFEAPLDEIGFDEFDRYRMTNGAVVVDSRLPEAYSHEHVPGAVNVPVAIGWSSLHEVLSAIPKDQHIIVYCQSEKCRWSDDVANHFFARGYRRVSVYRGGMRDWRARRRDRLPELSGSAASK